MGVIVKAIVSTASSANSFFMPFIVFPPFS